MFRSRTGDTLQRGPHSGNSLTYDLRVVEGIATLRFEGRTDQAEHERSRADAFALCRDRMIQTLLVDVRHAAFDMSDRDLFEFGRSFDETAPLRIAVVIREHDHAPNMITAVAQTKDVPIRVFLDEREAIDWLGQEPTL